jgi:hypothetical protein
MVGVCPICRIQIQFPEFAPPVAGPIDKPDAAPLQIATTGDSSTGVETRPAVSTSSAARVIVTGGHPLGQSRRPWFRDPVIVFGWLIPAYVLAGFVAWVLIDLNAKSVPSLPRNGDASGQASGDPVDSSSETKPDADDKDTGKRVADAPASEPSVERRFDLRGPVPPVGFKVRERITVDGVSSGEFLKPKAKPILIKSHITSEAENVYTVTAVANGQVVGYVTEIVTGHMTSSFVGVDGRARTSEKVDDLIEQTVSSKRIGDDWVHGLLNRAPTKTQETVLRQRAAWFADRDSLPREKQAIGSSWALDKAHIRKLVSGGVAAVSGNVEGTLVGVEEHANEIVAVIDYKGSVRGRFDSPTNPGLVGSMDLAIRSLRSLATGVDLTTTGTVAIRSNYTINSGGAIDVTEVISQNISSAARVENGQLTPEPGEIPGQPAVGALPNRAN